MKKLMIAAAIAMVAGITQAATAKWSASNVRIPVAKDVTVSQSGIVTTTDSAKFAAGALTINLYYQDENAAWTKITSAATTGDGVKAGAEFWTQAQAEAVMAATGNNTIQFMIDATYATADGTYTYAGYTSKDLGNIASSVQNVPFNMNSVGSWDFVTSHGPGPDPTPEPTTGLLMLVGLAGLALRRKLA